MLVNFNMLWSTTKNLGSGTMSNKIYYFLMLTTPLDHTPWPHYLTSSHLYDSCVFFRPSICSKRRSSGASGAHVRLLVKRLSCWCRLLRHNLSSNSTTCRMWLREPRWTANSNSRASAVCWSTSGTWFTFVGALVLMSLSGWHWRFNKIASKAEKQHIKWTRHYWLIEGRLFICV